jgi:hypothetical protein
MTNDPLDLLPRSNQSTLLCTPQFFSDFLLLLIEEIKFDFGTIRCIT